MCHTLKSVIEGRDADNLAGPSNEPIEDLGRCVGPIYPSLLRNLTSNVRIVHHVESAVGEQAKRTRELREHHLGSTKERLMVWRAEIWEILGAFEVCGFQLIIVVISKSPQGDRKRGGVLEVGETNQLLHGSIDAEPLTSVLSIGESEAARLT